MISGWTQYFIVLFSICEGVYVSSKVDLDKDVNPLFEDYGSISDSLELPECTDQKFLDLLVHFKIATPEDLITLSTNINKPQFCDQLEIGREKIVQYLRHCYPTSDQALYIKLLSGFVALKEMLCDDTLFQDLFKKHKDCFKRVQYRAVECNGPEDWIEYKNQTEICNIIKRIIGCYYKIALFDCGLISAEILNELMIKLMNAANDVECPNIMKRSYITDLRSLSNRSSSIFINKIFLLALACLWVAFKQPYDGG